MKKIIKNVLIVLVLLFSVSLAACNGNNVEPDPEVPGPNPEVPDPDKPNPENPDKPVEPSTTEHLGFNCISLEDAIKLAKEAGDKGTLKEYNVFGTVKEIKNFQYGEMIITNGTTDLYIYGVKGDDGTFFDKLTNQPQVNDEVVLNGKLKTYNGKVEMDRSKLKALNHTEVEINPEDYKKVSVKNARLEPKNTKVMVEGNVVKVTYADKMVPNGFFLMDYLEGETIYVYGKGVASKVKLNEKVTVIGTRSNYINPKEADASSKFNYTGALQITDASIYEATGEITEPKFDKVKQSTIKELINDENFDNVTGNIVATYGVIKKSINPGFVNYYINDLDLKTGSYCYSGNSGADYTYLDPFDGKTVKIILSVINCKCTDAGIVRRFVPIYIEEAQITKTDKELTQFVYDNYVSIIFRDEIPNDAEIDLVKTVTNSLFNLEGLSISYSSLNSDILAVKGEKIVAVKEGTGKIKVTIKLRNETLTNEVTIKVNKKLEATHTIKQAIEAKDNTEVTLKGIVLSSLVNRTGFYLIDETGVIAVTTTSEALNDIHQGDEVIIKGMRIHKKKAETGDNIIGQSVISDSVILENTYGNHQYSDSLFDKTKTLTDLTKLDVKDDYSTHVYTLKALVNVINNQYYTSIEIADPANSEVTMRLYCSSAKQYKFLEQFASKEVTLELALCNWNDKKYYTACVISADDGTTKVMNTLNFPK